MTATSQAQFVPRKPTRKDLPVWARVLRSRREFLGLSPEQVAELTEDTIKPHTVYDYENARTNPQNAEFYRLARYASALRWTPFEMQTETKLDLGLHGQPGDTATNIPKRLVPLRDLASAGVDVESSAVREYIEVSNEDWFPGLELYRAEGNSMYVADANADSIRHGDILYVNSFETEPVSREIFVVRLGSGNVVVKRLEILMSERFGGAVILTSDNPTFGPIFPDEDARIVGRVKFWTRKMKASKNGNGKKL
jgi:SOS-response transcriptional repressor LexA